MSAFQFALFLLNAILAAKAPKNTSQAVADAIAAVQKVYNDLRTAAAQNREMTPEEEKALDDRAELVFSSPASDPNANA